MSVEKPTRQKHANTNKTKQRKTKTRRQEKGEGNGKEPVHTNGRFWGLLDHSGIGIHPPAQEGRWRRREKKNGRNRRRRRRRRRRGEEKERARSHHSRSPRTPVLKVHWGRKKEKAETEKGTQEKRRQPTSTDKKNKQNKQARGNTINNNR